MAAASATTLPSVLSNTCVSRALKTASSCSVRVAAGLPALRRVKVSCSVKDEQKEVSAAPSAAVCGLVVSALAAAQPALAAVDGTEGSGFSVVLGNPLLGWFLPSAAILTWCLGAVYLLYSYSKQGSS